MRTATSYSAVRWRPWAPGTRLHPSRRSCRVTWGPSPRRGATERRAPRAISATPSARASEAASRPSRNPHRSIPARLGLRVCCAPVMDGKNGNGGKSRQAKFAANPAPRSGPRAEARLTSREAWLTSRRAGLTSRRAWLASRRAGLTSRRAWLASRRAGLTSREAWLTSRRAGLTSRRAWLASRRAGPTRRRAWLARRRVWLTSREAWLTSRRAWLASREAWLTSRGAWLTSRGAWLTSRRTAPAGSCLSEESGDQREALPVVLDR